MEQLSKCSNHRCGLKRFSWIVVLGWVGMVCAGGVVWGQVTASDGANGEFEDRVEIAWDPAAGDDITYRISRDDGTNDEILGLVSSQESAYTDNTGLPGQVYSYKVEVIHPDDLEEVVGS